jgi:hypothetical protein
METLTRPPVNERQQELIRRTCLEAEERIARARDRGEALLIREQVCERFGRECQSAFVVHALRHHLMEVIRALPARPAMTNQSQRGVHR